MTPPALITLGVLAVSLVLFVSDRVRLDIVALLALLSLLLFDIVPVEDALAGFSNPVVIMLVGLFVIGGAITETGLAGWLGQRLGHLAGEGEGRTIAVVMLATAALSAFMSSTGTVAILMPVVGTLALRRGIAPARIYLPFAFAAHLGSMLTLISTPPNLIVSGALRDAGHEPFRFFTFFPIGVVMLAAGMLFLIFAGKYLLPSAAQGQVTAQAVLSPEDFATEYGLGTLLHSLRVPRGSKLMGRTLGEANLRSAHAVNVVGISLAGAAHPVVPHRPFGADEVLVVQGHEDAVVATVEHWGLERLPSLQSLSLPPEESLAEVVIPRRSALVGRTLRQARFRDQFRATVLAIRRGTDAVVDASSPALKDFTLRRGDTLLVKGRKKHLRNLSEARRDLVLLAEPDPRTDRLADPRRAALTVIITLAMLTVMALGLLPNVVAVLLAAVAMVLTGCVRPADVYRTVNWESVVLIAGMFPLATALERTGVTQLAVAGLERLFTGASPHAVLAVLAIVTSTLGLFISNTATAVLVAPVALRIAESMDLRPEPLLMAVAITASAAFATPIASPVNTLVMSPGGYRFADYARVGIPLQVLIVALAVLVVPWVLPF
ncbi:SLC13 family permease [Myxococcus sp. NMCA1]|uniref:SLC13 family permease n=1 Tax=Myxococcus sp. NMCA1 TaxID=2996785 RepID=UPI002285C29B|nr:SLC13 family permease [Myxococcus sp. NMCA1]WAM29422.1 SLC13 family permease [Myxococcus sp. NMCA1]